MVNELRVKHEKLFEKREGWDGAMFRIPYKLHKMKLVHYSQLCLIEGLIFFHFTAFKTGIFRVRMHDFSMLPF